MGQAFDRDGNVLGEAYGDSKREVFDKLTEQFKEAAELRIKTIGGGIAAAEAPPVQRDRMLQFFTYSHLPDHLAKVSLPFCQLAEEIAATLPSNAERTVALRKLLEAKDCAVRALLFKG
jgi:hypothetical protein